MRLNPISKALFAVAGASFVFGLVVTTYGVITVGMASGYRAPVPAFVYAGLATMQFSLIPLLVGFAVDFWKTGR